MSEVIYRLLLQHALPNVMDAQSNMFSLYCAHTMWWTDIVMCFRCAVSMQLRNLVYAVLNVMYTACCTSVCILNCIVGSLRWNCKLVFRQEGFRPM